jgi:hypothetical protein
MKRKLMEFLELKKECMELRRKEEAWIKVDYTYIKINKKYKHMVEGLKREKQLWL